MSHSQATAYLSHMMEDGLVVNDVVLPDGQGELGLVPVPERAPDRQQSGQAHDDGTIEPDARWVRANIVTTHVPVIGSVQVGPTAGLASIGLRGLPPANGYVIDLRGESEDGQVLCRGDFSLDVGSERPSAARLVLLAWLCCCSLIYASGAVPCADELILTAPAIMQAVADGTVLSAPADPEALAAEMEARTGEPRSAVLAHLRCHQC